MSRIAPPDRERVSERQREVYEAIRSGPRGQVRGPLAVWLRRPELADRAQALGHYCRYDTLLPPRLSELAILTVARIWGSTARMMKPSGHAARTVSKRDEWFKVG